MHLLDSSGSEEEASRHSTDHLHLPPLPITFASATSSPFLLPAHSDLLNANVFCDLAMRLGRPWLSKLEEGSRLGRHFSWAILSTCCVISAGLVAWAGETELHLEAAWRLGR